MSRGKVSEKRWYNYQKYCKYNAENYVNRRENNKRLLVQHKGGKCNRCGYNKDCLPAYHFHHMDPSQKEFAISRYGKGVKNLLIEVEKCELVCANCHAEIEYIKYQQRKLETIQKLKNIELLDRLAEKQGACLQHKIPRCKSESESLN